MIRPDEPLEHVLREILAEDLARRSEHPPPAHLLAYPSGRLGGRRRRRIQEHLARCPECARILLDFESFPQRPDGDEKVPFTEAEREAVWRALSPHVRSSRSVWWQRVLAALASPQLAYATAAVAVCAALIILSVRPERGTPAAAGPTARIAIFDLVPEDMLLREGEPEAALRIDPRLDRVVWILNAPVIPPFPAYRIEILDSRRRFVWRSGEVTPGLHGSFALELPARFLPPGTYRVHLEGQAAAGPQLIARYNVQLR